MPVVVELPVSLPELPAVRWTSDALHAGMKDSYAVGRVERGRCEWWGRGKVWRSAPGCIQIKQPGDVHRDLARDGAMTWPVRRAMEYLRERMTEPIRLDVLARHAELDKFHLCRAFRAQVGMPPHTYLIQLRVARAKELLLRGVRASEVAPRVGFYDQAQLTRHFRRIVGTTPARFGRGEGKRGDESMPLAGHATGR